jgi:glycosyltransferase involved in cell wall biosynthesis
MKILQLCKKFPYPLKDGESIAVTTLSHALHQSGCEVTLLAMNTSRHYFEFKEIPEELGHYTAVYTADVDNRINPWDAFISLLKNRSYHISRFDCAIYRKQLIHLLQEETFDIVQLETLYLAPYISTIRAYSDAVIVMRAHNVEHEIWQRIASNTRFKPKKWYLSYLAEQLKKYEIKQLKRYDLLAAITHKDLHHFQQLGYSKPSTVIPIGLPTVDYQPDYSSFHRPLSISFIGSLDWMPNQEGLKWFLNGVWGEIQKAYPDVQFHIAGRNTPNWLLQLKKKNIVVHGEVPNAADFINQHSVMVVPLLSGSGMRAKIIEAMALGRVVLSTSVGLEGIAAKNKKEVMIADDPATFLSGIGYCLEQASQLEGMGRAAHRFVNTHYNSLAVGKKLLKAYKALTVEAL